MADNSYVIRKPRQKTDQEKYFIVRKLLLSEVFNCIQKKCDSKRNC
jgi:hypothetical protein